MKLLVVGNRVPWPLNDGGAIATYGMLRSLVENGAEVDFFSFNTKKHFAENAIIEKYFGFCQVHLVTLDSGVRPLKAFLNLLVGGSYHIKRYDRYDGALQLYDLIQSGNYDCVMVEGLYSMPITLRVMKRLEKFQGVVSPKGGEIENKGVLNGNAIKWAYRSHNVEYQIWERLSISAIQPWKKWYLGLQAKRLKRYEINAWCLMNVIVPIVQTDANVIGNKLSEIQTKYQIRNGDSQMRLPKIQVYQPGIAMERGFAFVHRPLSIFHIGSMEWQANEQGVMWFLKKVWPLVLSVEPNVKFHLAGKGLSKEDPRFFHTGIVNHGEVDDAEVFMQKYGIMMVPIQAGSGIRIKSLEAMALGVPVVTTSIGAQGLSVSNGTQMIIANEPRDFAEGIIQLLSNPAKSQEMTKQAREYVELHHNLKRNTADLLAFLQSL